MQMQAQGMSSNPSYNHITATTLLLAAAATITPTRHPPPQ